MTQAPQTSAVHRDLLVVLLGARLRFFWCHEGGAQVRELLPKRAGRGAQGAMVQRFQCKRLSRVAWNRQLVAPIKRTLGTPFRQGIARAAFHRYDQPAVKGDGLRACTRHVDPARLGHCSHVLQIVPSEVGCGKK